MRGKEKRSLLFNSFFFLSLSLSLSLYSRALRSTIDADSV